MTSKELVSYINSGELAKSFARLYPSSSAEEINARFTGALADFEKNFGTDRDVAIFSVPGRSELSGNHTDHNHGAVIAASIDLDIIAVASPRNDGKICVVSRGFSPDNINIDAYTEPDPTHYGRSDSLIAGMCVGFANSGYAVGGFDAYTTSNVLGGSGLSSSAAFEVMIGNILNHLYNGGKISNVEIAKIAQFSENKFFGKPCGLMDQMACAVGGIIAIDFADPTAPIIEPIDFDLTSHGYSLCIVNTGGNHADLTPDYAAVPAEMKAVAAELGASVLRDADEAKFMASIPSLRKKCGDRAVLRALHFFDENRRVALQKEALKAGDLEKYFGGVLASGRSSFCYLQNVFTTINVTEQGLSLALCLAEKTLLGKRAAWRVHGGGFAGTVQVYVAENDVPTFRRVCDEVFGEDACNVLHIRLDGAIKII